MSDTVRNIITVLVVMVICVLVGAIIINVVAPRATQAVIGGVESGIHAATGIEVDLDGGGSVASSSAQYNAFSAGGSSQFQSDITAGGVN